MWYQAIILLHFIVISACCGCPLWFVYNTTLEDCQCGRSLGGIVECDEATERIALQTCYCMTHNLETNQTVVGFCLLTCRRQHDRKCQINNDVETNQASELNEVMCGRFNRRGQLCGECADGYGFPVYSYSMSCVNCSAHRAVKAWVT